ncbi:glycosyltransferase [uncultured Microbulbifer sp.]|uniref:glycosyltransferase n=1 Tax=uncultured Microbulbifer sp. TaxID=348147 RepID=UPI0025D4554A|nr:glycosyltransferase [uncultured Microbulbifer sp.]
MRIVQILPSMETGEVALTALEFAQELVKQGHESIVVSAGGELVSRLNLHGSQHLRLAVEKSSLRTFVLVGRLRALLQELAPDIVHARGPLPARLSFSAIRKIPAGYRPHLVTSIHEKPRRGLLRGRLSNAALCRGERVIAASSALATCLQQTYPSAFAQLPPEVIHRGVNTRELDGSAPVSGHWHQRILNDFPQLEGKHWLLLPAVVAPGQGQQQFLEMLAAIRLQRDDVFGLVLGDIPDGGDKYARKLENLAEQMGLHEHVLFLGRRRDMREFYASARITYDLAEVANGTGRVVAESLAMSCPAVTLAGSGAGAEIAGHCFPQGVIAENTTDALVNASLEILDSPRPICFDGFTLQDSTRRTLALYESLTRGQGQEAASMG